MEHLYNYVFHYNHFTGLWSAIPRSKYQSYWDNQKDKEILQSKELKTLMELITKGDDFIKSIKKK
jgi:hypothetical protein